MGHREGCGGWRAVEAGCVEVGCVGHRMVVEGVWATGMSVEAGCVATGRAVEIVQRAD